MSDSPKLISLDAAGTLIYPAVSVGETYAEVAGKFGADLVPKTVNVAFREAFAAAPNPYPLPGKVSMDSDRAWWRSLVMRVFAISGWEGEGRQAAFDELFSYYAHPDAWRLFADVEEGLSRLARFAPLWVNSNFDPRLHEVLDGLGIGHHFAGRTLSAEVGAAKPDPLIFQSMLKQAGVDPPDCLHVGDDERCDWDGARACGLAVWELRRPEAGLLDLANFLQTTS